MPQDETPWTGELDELLTGLGHSSPSGNLASQPPAQLPGQATRQSRATVPSWRRTPAATLPRHSSSHFVPAVRTEERDRGAAVARSTVAYRRKQQEVLPLVGEGSEVLAERSRLLVALAEQSPAKHRARLLMAAADLTEQSGDATAARELHEAAYQADSKDVAALRSHRRAAMARHDWPEVRRSLEAESGLAIADWERTLAFTALAELCLHRFDDAAAAERAARAAVTLRRDSVTAHLLLAEACFVQGRETEGWRALESASEVWADDGIKAALGVDIGRMLERRGQSKRAAETFAAAAKSDSHSAEAWLGLCRTARAQGDVRKAALAAQSLAMCVDDGAWQDACRHLAALWLWHLEKQPAEALKLLLDQTQTAGLRSLAAVATAVGDNDAALGAWVELGQSPDAEVRAAAMASLAELHVHRKEADQARHCLRAVGESAVARQHAHVVQLLACLTFRDAAWRLLSPSQNKPSDASRQAGLAAYLALQVHQPDAELEALQQLLRHNDDEVARALAIDAALASGRVDEAAAWLLRSDASANAIDQWLPHWALRAQGVPADTGLQLLEQACDALPNEPLLWRAAARQLAAAGQPMEAAQRWMAEAAASSGGAAAMALYEAAMQLQAAEQDALPLLEQALKADRQHVAALWRLHAGWLARGDRQRAASMHLQYAALDASAAQLEHAALAVVLALPRLEDSALPALLRLAQHPGDDHIAHPLLLRCIADQGSEEQAKALRAHAEALQQRQSDAGLRRMAWLETAAAFEASMQGPVEPASRRQAARSAIDAYRKVLEQQPKDPWALSAVWRLEVSAEAWTEAAKRRRDALQAATDAPSRQRALQALIDFDLHLRDEFDTASSSLQALARLLPDHLPTLFALQRHAMHLGRERELLRLEERWAELSKRPADVAAHARLAARLRWRLAEGDASAIDAWVQGVAERLPNDLWFARRSEHAARSFGDAARVAQWTARLATLVNDETSRAAFTLRAAEAAEHAGGTAAALSALGDPSAALAAYPTGSRLVGRLLESTQNLHQAATAYEQAANDAQTPEQAVESWYRAAVLWQDRVHDDERALPALRAVCDINITYLDAFDRLSNALKARERLPELSSWVGKRITAGLEGTALRRLRQQQAELCERLADRLGLQEAVQALLADNGTDASLLKQTAEMALRNQLWSEAVQALQALTHTAVDRQQLRWALLSMGDVQAGELNQANEAEKAYERALHLEPRDAEIASRLGNIYRQQNNAPKAVAFYRSMLENTTVWQEHRTYSLALMATLEAQGQVQEAEAALERARVLAPTDLGINEAFAAFYRRQNAPLAETRHLQRAVDDCRQAIAHQADQPDLWKCMARALQLAGRPQAAAAVASAAGCLGMVDVEFSQWMDGQGAGAAPRPSLAVAGDALLPRELDETLLTALACAAPALEKLLPLDLDGLHAQKIGRHQAEVRDLGRQLAKRLGTSEPHLWSTEGTPRLCLCVTSDPLEIVVGSAWLQPNQSAALSFMLARALLIGSKRLAVAVSAPPEQLGLAYGLLLHSFVPSFQPPHADAEQLARLRKQFGKALGRRERQTLESLVPQLADRLPDLAAHIGPAVYEYANRVALVASGSISAALQALLWSSGMHVDAASSPAEHVAAFRRSAEAWNLLMFAISADYLALIESR